MRWLSQGKHTKKELYYIFKINDLRKSLKGNLVVVEFWTRSDYRSSWFLDPDSAAKEVEAQQKNYWNRMLVKNLEY